jgi:hypothetical protein
MLSLISKALSLISKALSLFLSSSLPEQYLSASGVDDQNNLNSFKDHFVLLPPSPIPATPALPLEP